MADYQNCWNAEEEIKKLGIEVPRWIDQDIDSATIASIVQGGCASGAYMPAVTYHSAINMMNKEGVHVFEFLDIHNAMPLIDGRIMDGMDWSGLAVHYMSLAVELWASSVIDEVESILEEKKDDSDDPLSVFNGDAKRDSRVLDTMMENASND